MSITQIVGICLVKNEDLFIERVLRNTLDFCDILIVLDNQSTDNTPLILETLRQQHPEKFKLSTIKDPMRSHRFVESYANTKTWVFKIDADELYDPDGLRIFRQELLSGKYQSYWKLDGPALNCTSIDTQKYKATGYLSPPSKISPNIYNFDALISWNEPRRQRLHGDNAIYKHGYNYFSSKVIIGDHNWDDSIFRCLHLAFVRRSSHDSKNGTRPNPTESASTPRKIYTFLRNCMSGKLRLDSNYKNRKYAIGKQVTKDIQAFFPNHDVPTQ